MSSRPLLAPFSVVTNAAMTGNITSAVTAIKQCTYISYDVQWTGTPTGTFSVQVSNTYQTTPDGNTVTNAGNWTPLTLSATPTASGSAGGAFIDIDGVAAMYMRLVYTFTSGTGTLNATVAGKVS